MDKLFVEMFYQLPPTLVGGLGLLEKGFSQIIKLNKFLIASAKTIYDIEFQEFG